MSRQAEIEFTSASKNVTERHSLETEVTRIGRSKENDIVLSDMKVSRRHAIIRRDEAVYTIDNISATNILLVNNQPVKNTVLHDGDTIVMGDSHLCFRQVPALEEENEAIPEPECITIDARNRDILLSDIDDRDLQALQRAKSDLTALYRAGRILNASLSTKDLCRQSLETIVEEMPAVDCCSIHLLNESTGDLECRASLFRSEKPGGLPRAFSRTMLNRVLAEHKGVLTFDAQGDGRFESARSISSLNIRSAMCVPMQVGNRLTGVLQAHTLNSRLMFTVDDLKLLTTFGMLSGAAIENARLYEKLDAERAVQTEKARLMQVMMHELKSPISGARMLAETLRMKVIPSEKHPEFLERIVDRLDNMLEWIKDALDLSKLKSGEELGRKERLDLVAVTREVAEEYRDRAEDKSLCLKIETAVDTLPVFLPGTQYRMVVSNLVSNAVKYTKEGEVFVSLEKQESHAVLTVRDTGIGIPGKDIPKMFGEFFRASNARAAQIEGSGVGLASVKCIVERLGGTLALQSEEGKGSTFTANFPLAS